MTRMPARLRALKRPRENADDAGRLRCEDGQMVVETALVLTCFFLLMFGIFGFAFLLFGYCNITYAARAAARSASVSSNTSLVPETSTSIASQVSPFLLGATALSTSANLTYGASNPTSTPPSGGSTLNTIGGTVSVTVTSGYKVVMPFTRYNSFTVSSSAQRTITR